jgi:ornithine carbamoyltransferase
MPKDFLTTAEWSGTELDELIESALRFKHGGDESKPLANRSVALVF